MNWIRDNKLLTGILGVMIAGALGLGIWLYLSYDAFATAQAEYKTIGSEITSLESGKLFPSPENVAAKSAKVKAYEEQVGKLREVLLVNQQAIKPITETDFQAKLKERSNEITVRAKRAGMDDLPAGFALDFSEYAASLPKSPEMAAELNLHLDVVERLVSILIDSGVKKLDSIARTKLSFEPGGAPVAAPAPAVDKNAKKPAKAGSSAPVVVEPVLDRYAVKIAMTCDQAPLQNVLNTLANPNPKVMPYFMVLRNMRIDNAKKDAPSKEEIMQRLQSSNKTSTPAPPPSGGTTSAPAAPTAQDADAITIMGDEKLHVVLEVDYIRLRPLAKTNPALTGGASK